MDPTDDHSCRKCSRRDSAANMVCCDGCDGWEHYDCAGVTDSISDPNRSWLCERCSEEARARPEIPNVSVAVSTVSNSVPTDSGAIPKVSSESKNGAGAAVSVVSCSTSASSKVSKRIQMCLDILEESKNLKLRMIAEEEKYLQAKFELLMKFGDTEDKKSCRSGVSAETKRERLEKWLQDGTILQDAGKSTEGCSRQIPAVPSGPVKQKPEEIKSSIPTSKTQSVLKSLEGITPERLPQQTSTPVSVQGDPVNALISPTTTSYYPRNPTGKLYTWPTQTSVPASQCGFDLSSIGVSSVPGILKKPTQIPIYSQVSLGGVTNQVPSSLSNPLSSLPLWPPVSQYPVSNQAPLSMTSPGPGVPLESRIARDHSHVHHPTPAQMYNPAVPVPGGVAPNQEQIHLSWLPYGQPLPPAYPWMTSNQLNLPVPPNVLGQAFIPNMAQTSGMLPVRNSQLGFGHQQAVTSNVGPTPPQLAARQVMPRDLPAFSGKPENWPIFYSAFRNTTEVCGYSDAENLA